MAKLVKMRGLEVFIADIRNCKNTEEEQTRVDKELGKIRKKFASNTSLTDYDKKKYVWKLLYIYMLGYDITFGHKQAADLIPAVKYAEKQVGYMACAILLNEKDDFLRLVINALRNDLISRNEAFQCLALSFVGNIGGQEMAQLLTQDVTNLLTNGAVRPIVRKKAALCLLRLIRKSSETDFLQPDTWSVTLGELFEERDLGVLMALVTLLLGIVSRNYEGYESLVPKLVRLLLRLSKKDVTPDYTYYGIASPWLQVKILRTLQYFPPPEDPAVLKMLLEILRTVLTAGGDMAKNINKNNAAHSIVFEAIALALALDADAQLLEQSVALLGKFIGLREPNIKYLGLENMVRLAEVPAVIDTVHKHQKAIIATLRDPDISVRRRGMDLLFTMCNAGNSADIVEELLTYLQTADLNLREDLVLKTAVLAERFFPTLQWYVDVSLTLIERAGEFASKDIWHSTVQLITNNEELHAYAARKVVEALQRGAAYEALICCAGFLLGEYGRLISGEVPLTEQFGLLHSRFIAASPETKALLLSTYLKFGVSEPQNGQLKQLIGDVFNRYSNMMDTELQQRACEYRSLSANMSLANKAVEPMQPFQKRQSLLLRTMAKKNGEETDEAQNKPTWMQADERADDEENSPRQVPAYTPASFGGANDGGNLMGLDDLVPVSPPAQNGNKPPPAASNGGGGMPYGLDSLLSDPVSSPTQSRSGPGPVHDPFQTSGDPHGLVGAPEPFRVLGDVQEWWRKLCQADSGILYEDQYLQIGMRTQFVASQGQLVLFFGNKHNGRLERVIATVPPSAEFEFQLTPVPTTLEAGQQMTATLLVNCLSPFLRPPQVQVGYSVGGQACNNNLPLPIVPTKFCSAPPNAIPREIFFDRWKAIPGPPQKISERVARLTQVGREALVALVNSLRLGVQAGIDPDPDNLVAVSSFAFTPAGGVPQQVPVMVRIEVEKTARLQFQITVATPDSNLSASLKDLLSQLIAKL